MHKQFSSGFTGTIQLLRGSGTFNGEHSFKIHHVSIINYHYQKKKGKAQ